MEILLHIGDTHEVTLVAIRVYGLLGGQGNAGGVLGFNTRAVTQWRKWCGNESLRVTLVGDVGNVIGLCAFFALGGKQILTTQLQAIYRTTSV